MARWGARRGKIQRDRFSAGAVNCGVTELIGEFFDEFLGLSVDPSDLHFRHMAARAFIVFAAAVTLARLGARRLLSHNAGFDIMVAVILGSVLSRGINGEASFFPTLGASAVLVALHHAL